MNYIDHIMFFGDKAIKSNIICRQVLTLNGTSTSNIDASPQDLTAEFEVRMITEMSNDCTLFGYDSATYYVRVAGGGTQISIFDGGTFGTSDPYSGDLLTGAHEVIIKTDTGKTRIFVDGEDLGDINARTFTGIMNMFIGSHNSTIRHLNGRMYSFEMWTGGTSDTGTKIIDLPLQDGQSSTSVLNIGTLGGTFPISGTEGVDYEWVEECNDSSSVTWQGEGVTWQGDPVTWGSLT